MTKPAKVDHSKASICPKCDRDAGTTWDKAPDGGYLYTCPASYNHDGEGKILWKADPTKGDGAATGWTNEGVTADLVDPLLAILKKLPLTWIEYGVLEYDLRRQYPELFAAHVAEAGHVIIGGGKSTASSVRFTTGLQRLENMGIVTHKFGEATGEWHYNDSVSYWALLPVPADDVNPLTWADRATALGRVVADKWSDADVQGVRALVAAHNERISTP